MLKGRLEDRGNARLGKHRSAEFRMFPSLFFCCGDTRKSIVEFFASFASSGSPSQFVLNKMFQGFSTFWIFKNPNIKHKENTKREPEETRQARAVDAERPTLKRTRTGLDHKGITLGAEEMRLMAIPRGEGESSGEGLHTFGDL